MPYFQLFDTINSIEHELSEGETIIGRGADCDIRLLSSSVSRKHGMFEFAGDTLSFSDLGSSNGSFVNGQQVQAAVTLQDGDVLAMGDLRFTVARKGEDVAAAAEDEEATQLAPPPEDVGVAASADEEEIPGVWSEGGGLENASGTQFFTDVDSDAAEAYRQGTIELPPLGETPRLAGLTGAIKGQVFALEGSPGADGAITWKIGREPGSVDLVVKDSSVSGQHAQLVNEGQRWKVVNWMSTNGTFVNGQRGLSTYLKNGDVIRMGSAELAFELPNAKTGRAASKKPGLLSRIFGKKKG